MFIFKKTKDPQNRFELADIEYQIDSVTAEDTVEYFLDFMSGCGFHKQSVLRAFQSVIDQHEEE